MAHFAKIENGIVTNVIVVHNNEAPDEATGQAFIASIGLDGEWKQTSYNTRYIYEYEYDDNSPPNVIGATIVGSEHTDGGTPFRGTYAGIGYIYDAVTDTFTPPPTPEVDDETV